MKKKRRFNHVSKTDINKISTFEHQYPIDILGAKVDKKIHSVHIITFLPKAINAYIKTKHVSIQLDRISTGNIYSAVIENTDIVPEYTIHFEDEDGNEFAFHDPYNFPIEFSDYDEHLFAEGNHNRIYEKLGAHKRKILGKQGVMFTLWAPNAKAVALAGEFNSWTPGMFPMQKLTANGIWGLFIPGINDGVQYKFAVKDNHGNIVMKTDPFAFESELRPSNASIISSLNGFKWTDKKWINKRKKTIKYKTPISIYELHLGTWKKDFGANEWGFKNYRDLAHEIVEYVNLMGYTHIELLPVMEHPLDNSWGYQVVNYYAPSSRYGTPQDFMYFVNHCHLNGIGVILDWVPGHFPTDAHGLAKFDGTAQFEYSNPLKSYHKDWGTLIFDYGKNEVRNFLIANALFWIDKYHIDGLRVDAVASMLYLDYSKNDGEWEPNIYGGNENLEAIEFLKRLNDTVHREFPGILTIAEESTSWHGITKPSYTGGLGFDMKWNMGWMHDTLFYFSQDPVYRKFHHNKITFSLWYSFNEDYLLPLSHDEVVHGKKSLIDKMSGDLWQRFANLKLLYGMMFGHPGKKLNFMTNDIAQYLEWNSNGELNWDVLEIEHNKKFNLFFRDIAHLYRKQPALFEVDFKSNGFRWLDFKDADNSVLAFARFSADNKETIIFTFNMTPVIRTNYVFGVPQKGIYREILNSDAVEYGGSGVGNLGEIIAEEIPHQDFLYSIKVTLPPLAVNVFKLDNPNDPVELSS